MSSSVAATWVKFFTNAGIEGSVAASYAHIFVENRIRTDMLNELNKEYLKEMGILPTGDIISILRHAKTVNDQSVRDKILSSSSFEPVINKAVAKIRPASSLISTHSSIPSTIKIAPPRRVLPEHEGKYKVSLPKGETQRSREILAKRSALQMDKTEKKSIFDRLNSSGDDVEMSDNMMSSSSLTKLGKVSSSVFNRLGDYEELERKMENKSSSFAGILKNTPLSQPPKGIFKTKVNPRTIIKRSVVKVAMDTDESEDFEEKMDSDEKMSKVSFSPEVEVLEIEPRRQLILNTKKMNRLKNPRIDGIKKRIGTDMKFSVDRSANLHTMRKTISMKPKRNKISISPARNSKMKADQSPISIKSRLNLKNYDKDGPSVFNRLGMK